nr:MAG TPA: hypothetical protein [Caudoviricetes sp.]
MGGILFFTLSKSKLFFKFFHPRQVFNRIFLFNV